MSRGGKPWSRSESAPSCLSDWVIEYARPPYAVAERLSARQPNLLRQRLHAEEVRGPVLLCTFRCCDPREPLAGVDWLLAEFPGVAIVARMAPQTETGGAIAAFAALLTRISRRGVLVLVSPNPTPILVAEAVRRAFEPEVDLPVWLSRAMPSASRAERQRIVEGLSTGLAVCRSSLTSLRGSDERRTSRQPRWVQVGRALGAALTAQRRPDSSGLRIAHLAGYADDRSLARAWLRAFGLARLDDVRGTAGWEWLMWRSMRGLACTGAGSDRRKFGAFDP